MSVAELTKQLFGAVKDAALTVAPGLENFAQDVKAEMSRQCIQTRMELASALFAGSAFVPYGPGQYTPSVDHAQQQPEPEQIQSREPCGMER
jgi:hypothetical protein